MINAAKTQNVEMNAVKIGFGDRVMKLRMLMVACAVMLLAVVIFTIRQLVPADGTQLSAVLVMCLFFVGLTFSRARRKLEWMRRMRRQ